MSISKKIEYRHYFDPVPLDFTFEDRFKYKLVESEEELKSLLANSKGSLMAYDCETDGLDYNNHQIVGFSFSFNDISGYYVPLRHEKYEIIESKVPKLDESGNVILSKKDSQPLMKKVKVKEFTPYNSNLNPKNCLDIIYEAMSSARLVLMHNSIFDMTMLKKEGYVTQGINIFDTMCLTYNADTNATGCFGLKPASEHFLGRRAIKFKEVLGKEKTFKYVNPVDCAQYASSDTANTFGLFNKLYPVLKAEGCDSILKLDNKLVKCFLDYYVGAPLYIDKVVMGRYRDEILARKEELEMSIYNAVGYPFNIRSKSNELVKALKSLGIDTGVKTDGGAMSTSKDALNNVIDEHPIVKELIELSSLEKQLNSYIDKLANCQALEDNSSIGICRVNYKLFGTASGRLASGNSVKSKGDENDYFINLNIQNLTKPKPAIYEAVRLDNDYDGVLGWNFILRDKKYIEDNPDGYYVEGQSPEVNVRRAVRTKDDSELILSIDFQAQEIKLAGILSGEPNFVEPFKHGRDVHTEMAKKLFGSKYDKSKRKAAKVANFGLLYGGNAMVLQAVARSQGLELTDDEAQELFTKWWATNGILKTWKNIQLDKATKNKFTVKDIFGRPRRVKHYLTSDEKGVYNFGVRTIASHLIQGSGSSIMRSLMVKLKENIFSHPKYGQEVQYVSSVHDEVNYRINKRRIIKWVKVIEEMMVFQPSNFPIPINCSIELGDSLGTLFPFVWEDSQNKVKLLPKRI